MTDTSTSDSDSSSAFSLFDVDDVSTEDEIEEERFRTKNENYFEQIIPRYSNEEFMEHFRISREVIEGISEQFEHSQYYSYQSGKYGKLSALQQVHIYLWFVGHQTASYRDVADRFNVALSTLHHIVKTITYFLSNLSMDIITWPTLNEKAEIEQHFQTNGFPGVIGVIDGTHVKIDKPTNDPDSYLNRKHFFSIQVGEDS